MRCVYVCVYVCVCVGSWVWFMGVCVRASDADEIKTVGV